MQDVADDDDRDENCAASRHLAFRRFVALKNKPNCFYSDNVLTFKSADKKLNALLGKGIDPIYNYAYYKRLRFSGSSAQQLPLGQPVLPNVWLEFSKNNSRL